MREPFPEGEIPDEILRSLHARRQDGLEPDLAALSEQHPEIRQDAQLLCRLWALLDTHAQSARPESIGLGTGPPLTREAGLKRRLDAPFGGGRRSPEKKLGDFLILRPLGQGGMGRVYLAAQSGTNRLVALKTLPGFLALRQEYALRFKREIEAAASVRHPNVAQIYCTGEENGILYYAMEYVNGQSLDDYFRRLRSGINGNTLSAEPISRKGRNPSRPQILQCIGYLIDAARAIHAIHEAGIVHRDVKPQNILLSDEGAVKIVDFGLAQVDGSTTLTRSGAIPGTPLYLSPEAITRKSPADRRSDVFSLGVILYEIITGESPWDDSSIDGLYHEIVHVDPVSPRRLHKQVPRDLETIMLKAIEKDSSRRYPTAAALADDLERFLRFEPISARPSRFWIRGLKAARRHPGLAITLATTLILVISWSAWCLFIRPAVVLITAQEGSLLEVLCENDRLLSSVSIPEAQAIALDLPPGSYRMRVSLPKHVSQENVVILRRGSNPSLSFKLPRDQGMLMIESSQEKLKVQITQIGPEGEMLPGNTLVPPTTLPIALDSGKYLLTCFGDENWWQRSIVEVRRQESSRIFAFAPPVRTLWSVEAGAGAYSSRVVDMQRDGKPEAIIATGNQGVLIADAATGMVLDRCRLHGMVYGKPVAEDLDGDGKIEVVAASWEEGIGCFHPRLAGDGPGEASKLWVFQLPPEHRVIASLLVSRTNGMASSQLIVADNQGEVHGIDPGGKTIWNVFLPQGVAVLDALALMRSGETGKDEIVVACNDGVLYWLDPGSQAADIRRKISIGKGMAISGITTADLDHDGDLEIIVGTEAGEVHRLGARGEIQWCFRVPAAKSFSSSTSSLNVQSAIAGAPAVFDIDEDGLEEILFACTGGTVFCLDTRGEQRWSRDVGASIKNGPVVGILGSGQEPFLVLCGVDYRLFCLRGIGGEVQWTRLMNGPLDSIPTIADLDGDGTQEILVGSKEGKAYAISGEGDNAIWSRKLRGDPGENLVLADWDGDGKAEIFLGTRDNSILCLNSDGTRRWGFRTGGWVINGAGIADLDGDGHKECLAASFDGRVYCLSFENGSARSVWRQGGVEGISVGSPVSATPLIADLEQDGKPEVLIGTWSLEVFCFDPGGALLWKCTAGSLLSEDDRIFVLQTADLDGDGILEILAAGSRGRLHCIRKNQAGSWLPAWEACSLWEPVVADLDRDGRDEVLVGMRDKIVCLDSAGSELWTLPQPEGILNFLGGQDIDGDGEVELFLQNPGLDLRCLTVRGETRWSYPSESSAACKPIFSDFDTDGTKELLVISADGIGRFLSVDRGSLLASIRLAAPVWAGAAVGNLSGDSRIEIVLAGFDNWVHCFETPEELRRAAK